MRGYVKFRHSVETWDILRVKWDLGLVSDLWENRYQNGTWLAT